MSVEFFLVSRKPSERLGKAQKKLSNCNHLNKLLIFSRTTSFFIKFPSLEESPIV